MTAARKKLNSSRGDSITEVLVALLISAVAMVMLASMISVSTNMIKNSEKKLAAYYEENEALTLQTSGTSDTGKITFSCEDGTAAPPPITGVTYRVNDGLGAKSVVAFWK